MKAAAARRRDHVSWRARGLLIAAQFALAILLLAGAGLLIRSFLLLNAVPPGFDTSHLLTMTVPLGFERYAEQARSRAFYGEAIRRVEALPGVRGAALGSAVFGSFRDHVPNPEHLVIEGRPLAENIERHGRDIVSDNYFRVMGIPLRDGRLFSAEDASAGAGIAVVEDNDGTTFLAIREPDRQAFQRGAAGPGYTVAYDHWRGRRHLVQSRRACGAGVPTTGFAEWALIDTPLVVRTAGDPLMLASAVRQAIRSVDATVPWFDVTTAEHELAELDHHAGRRTTQLIGAFAVTALVLAALGLYGLMSYFVEQRTKEMVFA